IFRMFNSFFELREHSRRDHDDSIPAGCVINISYPESGKVCQVKTGAWSQYWLYNSDKAVKKDVPVQEPKKKEKKKPKMDNVKLVDKGDVKHPDKKNPFCFLPDIKVVSAKGPESKPYTPFPNKDLQNKDSRLEVTFLKETSKWGTFLKLCKDKDRKS